jgi:hypothetical protein
VRMGFEMILSARPTVEHDDLLRVWTLGHGAWPFDR